MCLLLAVRAGAGRGAGLWNLAESIWGQGEGLGASPGARVFGAQWAWGQRAKCLERGIYGSRPSGLGEGWAEGSTWSRWREPGKAVPPTACRADTAAAPNHHGSPASLRQRLHLRALPACVPVGLDLERKSLQKAKKEGGPEPLQIAGVPQLFGHLGCRGRRG